MNFSEYIIGLDLGQAAEFTALAVVEKAGHGDEATYSVRHLKRYQPGGGYLKILDDLAGMIETGPLKALFPVVIIDGTSAGAAVVGMFRSRLIALSVNVIAALITGGDAPSKDSDWTRIPKRDLVSSVQVVLQTERIKIAQSLPDAKTLISELQNFKAQTVSASTDPLAAWREGSSDDLVLALALPIWVGMQQQGEQECLVGMPNRHTPLPWQ